MERNRETFPDKQGSAADAGSQRRCPNPKWIMYGICGIFFAVGLYLTLMKTYVFHSTSVMGIAFMVLPAVMVFKISRDTKRRREKNRRRNNPCEL